jgi:hypothetical protein
MQKVLVDAEFLHFRLWQHDYHWRVLVVRIKYLPSLNRSPQAHFLGLGRPLGLKIPPEFRSKKSPEPSEASGVRWGEL